MPCQSFSPTGWKEFGYSMTPLRAWCGNRLLAVLTRSWMSWQNTSRMRQMDSKSSSRQNPFQATMPDSFGLEPNTEAIGIGGQSGNWKDGCVPPSLSFSKALPKRSSCRCPLKADEIRRWGQKEHACFENTRRSPKSKPQRNPGTNRKAGTRGARNIS